MVALRCGHVPPIGLSVAIDASARSRVAACLDCSREARRPCMAGRLMYERLFGQGPLGHLV